jgi:hypothetical protein
MQLSDITNRRSVMSKEESLRDFPALFFNKRQASFLQRLDDSLDIPDLNGAELNNSFSLSRSLDDLDDLLCDDLVDTPRNSLVKVGTIEEFRQQEEPMLFDMEGSLEPPLNDTPSTTASPKQHRKRARKVSSSNLESVIGESSVVTAPAKKSKNAAKSRQHEPQVKSYIPETEIRENDVLAQRGAKGNKHPGSRKYREICLMNIAEYKSSSKDEKTRISQMIVDHINEVQKGRFLQFDKKAGMWFEMSSIDARTKTSQCLRDPKTPEARKMKRAKYGC